MKHIFFIIFLFFQMINMSQVLLLYKSKSYSTREFDPCPSNPFLQPSLNNLLKCHEDLSSDYSIILPKIYMPEHIVAYVMPHSASYDISIKCHYLHKRKALGYGQHFVKVK